MTRAVFAFAAALLVTGAIMLAALEGVSWLMTSRAVWSVVREPWFKPSIFAFNVFWPSVWLPFYIFRINNRKKSGAPANARLR